MSRAEGERSHDDSYHLLSAIGMPERRLTLGLMAFIPAYALIGLVAVASDEGPHSGSRLLTAGLVLVTTIPAMLYVPKIQFGRAWIERFGGGRAGPESLFRVYADIGVAVVLFTFVDYEAALFGSVLFAITSMFVAHFEPTRVVLGHMVFSSAVIVTLAGLAWNQGDHDAPGIIARTLCALLVVNGTIGIPRRISIAMQRSFEAQFAHANRDPLTGLLNRRGFDHWTTMLLTDNPRAVGFLILDVDNFKAINDGYGHDVGDSVLRLLARRIEGVIGFRASAVSRSGGEEFAVAVAADHEELTALAEGIRRAAHDPGDRVPITVSVGAATGSGDHRLQVGDPADEKETISRGLTVADAAMYAAKAAGRNRVVTLDFADVLSAPAERPTERPLARVRDLRPPPDAHTS